MVRVRVRVREVTVLLAVGLPLSASQHLDYLGTAVRVRVRAWMAHCRTPAWEKRSV